MHYYPVFLDLRSRKTLVVGAGRAAERQVKSLLAAGAAVTVVAPEACPGLRKLAAAGRILWRARRYRGQDLGGVALAFSATDSREVDEKVAADAARRGVPMHCAGSPDTSSFLVPAQTRKGNLHIAIAAGGASPALALQVLQRLTPQIGSPYAAWSRRLDRLRRRVLNSLPARRRNRLLQQLASDRILRLLERGHTRVAAELADQIIQRELTKATHHLRGPKTLASGQRSTRKS